MLMWVIAALAGLQAHMPDRWRRLVQRDARGLGNPKGPVWGAPYRWGCTLIAYRKDALIRYACFPRR